jgi:hypothetical protein
MSAARKRTGVSTGGIETSPARAKARAKARARQEKRWAAKAGPVNVRYVCPLCGGQHAKDAHPD